MNNKIEINLQASNIYLILSIGVYFLNLFVAWYYFYTLWLSIIVSVLLSIWLFYFLPKLKLERANAIVKVSLDKDKLTTERNNRSIQQFSTFYPAYQSCFLVIINTGKESIVIFKDALTSDSISVLNRYFNTKANI